MLYATNRFPGDGTTTQYEISFVGGYLDRTHVKAYIEGADLTQTPVIINPANFLGPYTIKGFPVVPVGSTLVIYRDTPKAPIVDFVNSSRLTEANLDTATRQGTFIAAEGADAVSPAGLAGVLDQVTGFAAEAGVARDGAVNAATAVGTFASNASDSADTAVGASTAAAGYASSTLANKNASDTSAADADASATTALGYRDTAGTHASTATTQAGVATTKASESAASAAAALASKNAAAASEALAASYVNPANPNWNTPVVQSLNAGALAGFRNLIINGDMSVNQRGTTSVGVPTGGVAAIVADRWRVSKQGAQNVSMSHASTGLGSARARKCLAVQANNTYGNAAADYVMLEQRIEGIECLRLRGVTFTLSFLVKASRTGTYSVAIRNGAGGRSYIATYTVTAANIWEDKTITVVNGIPAGDADGAGAAQWNVDKGVGLSISFIINGGTSYQTSSLNSWRTSSVFVANTQTQGLQVAADTFSITEVQLEVGTVRTPFERRHTSIETTLCQRYFELVSMGGGSGANAANYLLVAHTPYKVQKRDACTLLARVPQLNFNIVTPAFNEVPTVSVYGLFRSVTATEFYYLGLVEAECEL